MSCQLVGRVKRRCSKADGPCAGWLDFRALDLRSTHNHESIRSTWNRSDRPASQVKGVLLWLEGARPSSLAPSFSPPTTRKRSSRFAGIETRKRRRQAARNDTHEPKQARQGSRSFAPPLVLLLAGKREPKAGSRKQEAKDIPGSWLHTRFALAGPQSALTHTQGRHALQPPRLAKFDFGRALSFRRDRWQPLL